MYIPSITNINFNQIQPNNIKGKEKTFTPPINAQKPDFSPKMPSAELLKVYSGVIEHKNDENVSTLEYLRTLPNVKQTFKKELEAVANVIDTNEKEAPYVSKLVDMVADGKLWRGILRYYCPNGETNKNVASDIDLIKSAELNNKNVKDVYVPHVSNKAEGINNVPIGETFEVEGEKNIYFKNSENEAQQLKMSKDMFCELFPPVERFSCVQGAAGDCYLLSTLSAFMNKPETRGIIYNMFEEKDKNLNITMPESDFTYTVPKDNLRQDIDKWQHMQGSTGMVLAEHAYGEYLQNKLENSFYKEMNTSISILQENQTENKTTIENYQKRIDDFREKSQNPEYKAVLSRFENPDANGKLTFKYDENGIEFKDLQSANKELRRKLTTQGDFYRGAIGGDLDEVMRDFGLKDITEYKTKDNTKETELKNLLFCDEAEKYIFTAGALSDGTLTEKPIAKDYSIYGCHAYRIQPFKSDDNETLFFVENPWNTTQNSIVEYDKLKEYFEVICATKVIE